MMRISRCRYRIRTKEILLMNHDKEEINHTGVILLCMDQIFESLILLIWVGMVRADFNWYINLSGIRDMKTYIKNIFLLKRKTSRIKVFGCTIIGKLGYLFVHSYFLHEVYSSIYTNIILYIHMIYYTSISCSLRLLF